MVSPFEHSLMSIFEIVNTLHLIFSLIPQAVLLILMIKCTSKFLRDMRLYLLNTFFLQVTMSVSAYISQCRVVPNKATAAMMCMGVCKIYGSNGCFLVFFILQTSLVACATSLILALHYRYKLLTKGVLTNWDHYRMFFLSYLIPLTFLVFMFIAPSDVDRILAEIRLLHPTYDIDSYAVIGFADVNGIYGFANTFIIMLGTYGAPVIACIYRRKILKILVFRRNNNKERIENSKSMIVGLTIQTVMPLICYFPVVTYYIYAQYSGNGNILAEFAVSTIGSIFTISDPILTIYFVLPYRKAFQNFFKSVITCKLQRTATIHRTDTASRSQKHHR